MSGSWQPVGTPSLPQRRKLRTQGGGEKSIVTRDLAANPRSLLKEERSHTKKSLSPDLPQTTTTQATPIRTQDVRRPNREQLGDARHA